MNTFIQTPSAIAHALFPKTRTAVLQAMFSNAAPPLHLREIARLAGVSPPMASKELSSLVAVGLITERRDGNRLYFHANRMSPIYEELANLITKTAGIAGALQERLHAIAGIELAFIFGSVANASDHSSSDIDLMVIGDASPGDLYLQCDEASTTFRRKVNVIIYSQLEINDRVLKDSPFLKNVLSKPRIALVGTPDDIFIALGGDLLAQAASFKAVNSAS